MNANEKKISKTLAITGTALAALMVCSLGWMSLVKIDRVVSAPGVVRVETQNKEIKHLEGGVVQEILVHDGDMVRAGQVLVRMSPKAATAENGSQESSLVTYEARAERLEAEASGRAMAENTGRWDAAAYADEKAMFDRTKRSLDEFLSGKERELAAKRKAMASSEAAAAAQESRVSAMDALVKSGNGSPAAVDLERQKLFEMRERAANYGASVAELETAISKAKADARTKAQGELNEVLAHIKVLRQQAEASKDKVARTEITAPVDGIIQHLYVSAIGDVVRPGDKVAEEVPTTDGLVIEAKVRTEDRGKVRPGMTAKARVSSWDFDEAGYLSGKVVSISADAETTQDGQSFYRAKIATSGKTADGQELLPGMGANVQMVVSAKRSLLSYFLGKAKLTASETFVE